MIEQEVVQNQINENKNFIKKTETLMKKIVIHDNSKRNMLLIGFSSNAIKHFLSINILAEVQLYNSAFALVRVLYENVIKLEYMYFLMDDNKINTLYKFNNWDNHFPKISKMIKDIDSLTNAKYYSDMHPKAYKIMNDYTHTGSIQIANNFNESTSTIESNYDDKVIINVLKSCKVLLKSTIVIFLEDVGYKNHLITKEEMEKFLKY